MPVGRVNFLKPLGHSGHRRLQLVVGSILAKAGPAITTGRFSQRER
jgi:hypothetical protein